MPGTETPKTILDFWFGPIDDDVTIATRQAQLWWGKNAETDAIIRTRYAALIEDAAADKLVTWGATPQGELARIILLDQLPRNIYRNDPRCFAHDGQALTLSLDGLKRHSDRALKPIERLFFYLPLEHAENLSHQERSVELFTRLAEEVPSGQRQTFNGFLDYARRHHEIIARFGRFPHRNAILGRDSTPDELEFLKQPGSSF